MAEGCLTVAAGDFFVCKCCEILLFTLTSNLTMPIKLSMFKKLNFTIFLISEPAE